MKKHIKTFLPVVFIIFILSFLIVLGINYTRYNSAFLSGIITAWVTINPLEVDVFCPKEVEIDKIFLVRAEAENKGEKKIKEAEAEIFLPEELELIREDEEQEIGIIPPKSRKFILWPAKGKEVGNYVISVKVSGELEGELVSAEDSTMVEIKKFPRFPRPWWRRFFDFLF